MRAANKHTSRAFGHLRFLGIGAAVLAAGAFAACYPTADVNGAFYCTSDADCPNGSTCDTNSGSCTSHNQQASGSDAGSTMTSGGHDAGTRPPPPPQDAGSTGPVGNPEYLCKSCNSNSDCGGSGNMCLQANNGAFCGTGCNSDSDCPANSKCWSINDPNTGASAGNDCFPTSGTCPTSGTPDAGTPHPDAGTPDAGTTHPDAGTPDAGTTMCTTDTWGSYAAGFFNNYCNQCHDFSSYSSVKGDASGIKSRISSGSMPQGQRLSSTEKARILQWLNCGLPQ